MIKHVKAIAALFAEGQSAPHNQGHGESSDSKEDVAPDSPIDLSSEMEPSARPVLLVGQNHRAPSRK